MIVSTGQTFGTYEAAIATGAPSDIVMVSGSRDAIASLSQACRQSANQRAKSQARRKQQRMSRRANR